MKKIRSKQELLDSIDDEYTWRFKEITDMRLLLKSQKPTSKLIPPFSRSLVVLSYSHWEGFVKYSSEYFWGYMTFIGLNRSQISDKLYASCLQHLSDGSKASDGIDKIFQAITDASYKFSYNLTVLTSAESNLNFEVLRKVSTNMGIDISTLLPKKNLLDNVVLSRRNDVAHGDIVHADVAYGVEVADFIIDLMKDFKNLIQNMISQEEYKR